MEAGHSVTASNASPKPPFWYKPLGFVALAWFGFACIGYYLMIVHNAEELAMLPLPQRTFRQATPVWMMIVYAVSVGGGLLGSMSLLMRMTAGRRLFLIALAATIVQIIWACLALPLALDLSILQFRMQIANIAVSAFLAWFSWNAGRRGWLI